MVRRLLSSLLVGMICVTAVAQTAEASLETRALAEWNAMLATKNAIPAKKNQAVDAEEDASLAKNGDAFVPIPSLSTLVTEATAELTAQELTPTEIATALAPAMSYIDAGDTSYAAGDAKVALGDARVPLGDEWYDMAYVAHEVEEWEDLLEWSEYAGNHYSVAWTQYETARSFYANAEANYVEARALLEAIIP